MKKYVLFGASVLAVGVSASTQQEQAYLAILVETQVMKMVGMEMPELPPGIELPPGVVLPGKPNRTLNVRLWSPGIAPANATASLAIPPGLKKGPKLDLELYRPKAGETGTGGVGEYDPEKNPEFTIKMYWGSSETVKEGQPKVIRYAGMTAEQKAEMKKRAAEAQAAAGSMYFYKPDWTTGYWPTQKQKGDIAADAALAGRYALTTTYTGNVEIDVPADLNFLAPISMQSPDFGDKIDFTKFIGFKWAPIPTALGSYASIIGMEGKNTLIMWSSSETYSEGLMGDMGFMQMADVRARVAEKLFMAPETTSVNVPAGIFANADMSMLNMVAYGPGVALDKTQPIPRVQTKTSLNAMLGGKGMP